MSVRPITVGEETKAFGHPFVNIFSVFGGLQGVLMFLHRRRIPVQSNWFAAPGSLGVFSVLVLGGFLTGGFVAMAGFSDWEIIRLAHQHKLDKQLNVEGQSIRNYATQA